MSMTMLQTCCLDSSIWRHFILAVFLHTLQLVIEDSIFSQRSVKDIIAKCHQIVGHFSHSASACEKLAQLQEANGLPVHKLIQDVKTRWNSKLQMLERVFEQRVAISAYSVDGNIPVISSYGYNLIENVIRVLKPFEEFTTLCSSDKEIASSIIPAVSTLKIYLGKQNKDAGVQTLKSELEMSLNRRFGGSVNNIDLNSFELKTATFLDPRYKEKFFSEAAKQEIIKGCISKLIALEEEQALGTEEHNEEDAVTGTPTPTPAAASLTQDIHEDIWACFEEAKKSGETTSDSDTSNASPTTDNMSRKMSYLMSCLFTSNLFIITRPTLSLNNPFKLQSKCSSIVLTSAKKDT